MPKHIATFTLLFCLLFSPGSKSFAQMREIVLATGEWSPYTSASLEEFGVFTKIVSAVFKELGLQPVYKFMPWKRAEKMVEMGEVFAAFPYVVTEERQKKFDYSERVAFSTGRLFYYQKRFSEKIPFRTLKDLKPYKVGGVRGYWYESIFKKAQLDTYFVNSEKQIIMMLHMNRVDVVPMDELVGWQLIRQLYPEDVQFFSTLEKPLNQNSLHLLISRKYENASTLTKQFNAALQRIREKGVHRSILQQYGIME